MGCETIPALVNLERNMIVKQTQVAAGGFNDVKLLDPNSLRVYVAFTSTLGVLLQVAPINPDPLIEFFYGTKEAFEGLEFWIERHKIIIQQGWHGLTSGVGDNIQILEVLYIG